MRPGERDRGVSVGRSRRGEGSCGLLPWCCAWIAMGKCPVCVLSGDGTQAWGTLRTDQGSFASGFHVLVVF